MGTILSPDTNPGSPTPGPPPEPPKLATTILKSSEMVFYNLSIKWYFDLYSTLNHPKNNLGNDFWCFWAICGYKCLFWPILLQNGHFWIKTVILAQKWPFWPKKDQKGFVLATDSPKTSEIITTDVLGRFKTEYRSKYSFLTLLTYYWHIGSIFNHIEIQGPHFQLNSGYL